MCAADPSYLGDIMFRFNVEMYDEAYSGDRLLCTQSWSLDLLLWGFAVVAHLQ